MGKSPAKENRMGPKKAPKKTPPKDKKKKESLKEDDCKKRKRIQVMSDSEDEAGDDDDKEDDMEEEAPPTSKLIESSEDDEIPPTPKQATRTSKPGRRRVRRQVDKTYVDDQGFMVTKKEYESASETDDEPEQVEEKTPKKVEKLEAPVAKKPKLVAPGGSKGQSGIMNFFKK